MKRGTRVRSIFAAAVCISLILTAFGGMNVAAATREELSQAVEEAELIDEFYYQPASFEKLEKAKEAARPFLEEGHGTQEELDKAYFALMDAIVGLKVKVEKNTLDACIISVGFLDKNRFQLDGWNAMVKALGKAKAIAANEASTQSQVDLALQNLVQSISQLVQKDGTMYEPNIDYDSIVDKTLLDALLHNVTLLDPKAFTELSWELFNGTLILAQEIADDPKAKKAEVIEIQNELILAQADLERDYSYGKHEGESFEFPVAVVQPTTPPTTPPTTAVIGNQNETTGMLPTEEPTTGEETTEDTTTPTTETTTTKPTKKTSSKPGEKDGGFPVLPVVLSIAGVVVVAAVVLIILKVKAKNPDESV